MRLANAIFDTVFNFYLAERGKVTVTSGRDGLKSDNDTIGKLGLIQVDQAASRPAA